MKSGGLFTKYPLGIGVGTFQKNPAFAWWVFAGRIVSKPTMNSHYTHWVNAPSPPVKGPDVTPMDLSRVRQRDMSKIKCYKCRRDSHYMKDCPVQINELTPEETQEILRLHFEGPPPPEEDLDVFVINEEDKEKDIPRDEERDTHFLSWSGPDRYRNIYAKDKQDFA